MSSASASPLARASQPATGTARSAPALRPLSFPPASQSGSSRSIKTPAPRQTRTTRSGLRRPTAPRPPRQPTSPRSCGPGPNGPNGPSRKRARGAGRRSMPSASMTSRPGSNPHRSPAPGWPSCSDSPPPAYRRPIHGGGVGRGRLSRRCRRSCCSRAARRSLGRWKSASQVQPGSRRSPVRASKRPRPTSPPSPSPWPRMPVGSSPGWPSWIRSRPGAPSRGSSVHWSWCRGARRYERRRPAGRATTCWCHYRAAATSITSCPRSTPREHVMH